MKNLLLIIFILLVAASCGDILEENPKAVATETFYKTNDEVETALYAVYGDTRRETGSYATYFWNLVATETDYAKGRGSFENESLFQGYNATDISRIGGTWTLFYTTIRDANLVIKNAPNAEKGTTEKINQFIAEAKFLRAFNYFCMVRVWAGLPLRTEENMTEPNVPRSSVSEVYELITSDLEYAEANLPDTQEKAGRADKYAAKSLLAHVYLQLERWSDARTKALDVINSGNYSLVEVETSDDFYNIFGPDVNRSSEEIFYIKYTTTLPSQMARCRHHPSVSYLNNTGIYALYTDSVNVKVISEWDHNDLRRNFMLYNCNIGFGTTTMLFKKFIDPDAPSEATASNDLPVYRYPDVLLIYAEADCRVNNGPTADGIEKLNMIHRRAYGYDSKSVSPVDFKLSDYDEESFIDLVLQEALYEQMDEGKRFLNLKRVGKLEEAVKYSRGIDVAEKHLLWPIPNVEYDFNDAIDPEQDQNPGY